MSFPRIRPRACLAMLLGLIFALPAGVQAQAERREEGRGERRRERMEARGVADATTQTTATATPAPTPTPDPTDLEATMTLALNNVPIDQIILFLGETTGKPVIKQKDINLQVTVTSPVPVKRGRALDLIYDALLLEGVFVIDEPDKLQIVNASVIKNMPMRSFGPDDDIQALPDSGALAQKIYQLKRIGAEAMKQHLEKIVPETAMSFNAQSNTLLLTDQMTRLKRYDRIILALESPGSTERMLEIFKLEHADAAQVAGMMAGILQEQGGEQQEGRRRRESSSGPFVAGDITLVPDSRMNWLIVYTPPADVEKVRKLVKELDQPEPVDVQTRVIEIKHVEAATAASAIDNLFRDPYSRAQKDQVRVVPSDDGSRLMILSSQNNFKLIQELIQQIDTPQAEKRETRTYTIKHLEAQDLAEQLTQLYKETQEGSMFPFWDYGRRSNQTGSQPSFVPSPRTNTLMVLARPKDYDFINRMIEELDVAVNPDNFSPRIYRIRHTDANELVKVLETLFKKQATQRSDASFFFYRPQSNDNKDPISALFGDLRFVVDNVTNTIVALSTNPGNYKILDSLIDELDRVDPEATEVLVHELKYANPREVADRLNNLFSDGAVQRAPRQQQNQQQNQQASTADDAWSSSNSRDEQDDNAEADTIYPWQSGGNQQRAGQEKERPINTMIGQVRVVPDTRSNKIIIAAPSIYFSTLRSLIESIDQQEPQVRIQTRIIEINRGDEKRIGLRWTPDPNQIEQGELDNAVTALGRIGFLDAFGSNSNRQMVESQVNSSIGGVEQTLNSTIEGANTILGADVNIGLLVQLLLKNSESRVISEPSLTVFNNEKGNIFVGSRFPFRENTQITDQGGISYGTVYRKIGIDLNITPHINQRGDIVLNTSLENSKIREGELIDGQLIPDVSEFQTQLAVESGQTMVIGGILIQDTTLIVRKTPVLGEIPVVNWLFRKRDHSALIRELMVFITPGVISGKADAEKIVSESEARIELNDPFGDAPVIKPIPKKDSTREEARPEAAAPPAPVTPEEALSPARPIEPEEIPMEKNE